MTGGWAERAGFLARFARSPALVGAVAPSSPALAALVTAPVPERGDPVVVELGAGTGTITEAVRRRLGGRGRQLAVELDAGSARVLRDRFPGVEVWHAAADEVPALLAARGLVADVVVSGLPWAAFRTRDGASLHRRLGRAMTGTAAFTQIAYPATRWAPPARRLLADLEAAFEEVVVTGTVWRNVPPAVAYLARRPRS